MAKHEGPLDPEHNIMDGLIQNEIVREILKSKAVHHELPDDLKSEIKQCDILDIKYLVRDLTNKFDIKLKDDHKINV